MAFGYGFRNPAGSARPSKSVRKNSPSGCLRLVAVGAVTVVGGGAAVAGVGRSRRTVVVAGAVDHDAHHQREHAGDGQPDQRQSAAMVIRHGRKIVPARRFDPWSPRDLRWSRTVLLARLALRLGSRRSATSARWRDRTPSPKGGSSSVVAPSCSAAPRSAPRTASSPRTARSPTPSAHPRSRSSLRDRKPPGRPLPSTDVPPPAAAAPRHRAAGVRACRRARTRWRRGRRPPTTTDRRPARRWRRRVHPRSDRVGRLRWRRVRHPRRAPRLRGPRRRADRALRRPHAGQRRPDRRPVRQPRRARCRAAPSTPSCLPYVLPEEITEHFDIVGRRPPRRRRQHPDHCGMSPARSCTGSTPPSRTPRTRTPTSR